MNPAIDRKTAHRVILTLRSGTTSAVSARETSVGTEKIMKSLRSVAENLANGSVAGELAVVSADWGFGKSHVRTLLASDLRTRGIPCIYDCVDGRGTSLAHIHRAVARWLEHVQIGCRTGLQNAVMTRTIPPDRALKWTMSRSSSFAYGLQMAIKYPSWGWHLALGHNYRSPDYGYQHPKAMDLLLSFADFLHDMGFGGIVLMLDEVENIDKQWDIRGRRKCYDTLVQMASHRSILPVLFVTDRLFRQIEADQKRSSTYGWSEWDAKTRTFVTKFLEREVLRPPKFNAQSALMLVDKIASIYAAAHGPPPNAFSPAAIVNHWQRASIRSVRFLVRLTVNELDLAMQAAPPEMPAKASQPPSMKYGQCPRCGKPLAKKKSVRFFLGCSGYPACTYTRVFQE